MTIISNYADEAFEILDSVRGKPQSVTERKQLSVELASLMLSEANLPSSICANSMHNQFCRLMMDSIGKSFTASMTDQCFRSKNNRRSADQMIYLLHQFGIPQYLPLFRRAQLHAFRFLGPLWGQHLVFMVTKTLRKEASQFILQSDAVSLNKHIDQRNAQGIRVNLIRIGEPAQSQQEVEQRLQTYLSDLETPNVHYLSIKISTLICRINPVDFDKAVETIASRLRILFRAAIKNTIVLPNGEEKSRTIFFDMEDYNFLSITAAVFRKLLEEPEFHHYSAGIALQSYFPDSRQIQKELTDWAKVRVQNGGAPIFVRLIKGAYLASEQVIASQNNWPLAPYLTKLESDANFKKMVSFGSLPENARAAHLGIGTHNLFDIAYSMLLRAENKVEPYVSFEMLEGVVEPLLHIVNQLTNDVILYTPITSKHDFFQVIAYLFRRLDDNSGPDNFLRHISNLKPGTESWENQTALFSSSCDEMDLVLTHPRRAQNRFDHPSKTDPNLPFENEAPTDFAIPQNRLWAKETAEKWEKSAIPPIPIVVNGQEIYDHATSTRTDPANISRTMYQYSLCSKEHLKSAIETSKKWENPWSQTSLEHRRHLLRSAAQKFRERRSELVGALMIDSSKIISEADIEVCQAIDFAEYYQHQMQRTNHFKDVRSDPIGTVLVMTPWNFPCSCAASGVLAALVAGNCVLFKPSSLGILVGWNFVNALWDAGIPKEVLQWIPASREDISAEVISDARINAAVFWGSNATARQLSRIRPELRWIGMTSGKNAIIVTAMADRELAIRNLIDSAFGHNGQKISAASLAILEAEVYDDPQFLQQLKEATQSLNLGAATDLSTQISPLLRPSAAFHNAVSHLEEGESWLLEPNQDPQNPNLYSPGIKLGIRPNSFMHQNELFGPILGLMRADSLSHAIEIANSTPYGIASGLTSLDEREHALWLDRIEASNCIINRPITQSIVRRQPLGGIKASSLGNGFKSGGPNYLREFVQTIQSGIPQEKLPVKDSVNHLTAFLEKIALSAEELGVWYASVSNYAYWWKRLRLHRDPNKIIGQDNFLSYLPRKNIVIRIEENSLPQDVLRIVAAALTVEAGFEISCAPSAAFYWTELSPHAFVAEETLEDFCQRIESSHVDRIRMAETAPFDLKKAAAMSGIHIADAPPLANGRLELLHYLREVSICVEYHRYGNLGIREGELRKPLN